MKEYPFVRCLDPQIITNKYTGEKLTVGCGKCAACLMSKSSLNTLKCQLESKSHLYAKFVTLTYSEDYIPRMKYDNGMFEINYDDMQPKLYIEYDYANYMDITRKVEHHDLPFLKKRDLQLFIKRLRRYYDRLSKKLNIPFGKIRYYAVGEYGPVHYRPHFHLIIWYSCEEIHKTIGEAVSSCWQFGRVSTETPRDDVSKYVAKYLNGSCYLPQIFKFNETKPFSVHSFHLGESFLQGSKEEIYESSVKDFVRRSEIVGLSYREFDLWRSLKVAYYPRCPSYSLFDTYCRLRAYTIKKRVYERFKFSSLVAAARYVLDEIYEIHNNPFIDVEELLLRDDYTWLTDLSFFIKMCNIDPSQLEYFQGYETAFRSVYMALRLSCHFIDFCCDGDENRFLPMVNKIERFYQDLDGMYLRDELKNLENHIDDNWFLDEDEYVYACSQNPVHIKKSLIFKRFRQETYDRYEKSMKHKRLNDLNRIFEYK